MFPQNYKLLTTPHFQNGQPDFALICVFGLPGLVFKIPCTTCNVNVSVQPSLTPRPPVPLPRREGFIRGPGQPTHPIPQNLPHGKSDTYSLGTFCESTPSTLLLDVNPSTSKIGPVPGLYWTTESGCKPGDTVHWITGAGLWSPISHRWWQSTSFPWTVPRSDCPVKTAPVHHSHTRLMQVPLGRHRRAHGVSTTRRNAVALVCVVQSVESCDPAMAQADLPFPPTEGRWS